MTRRKPPQTREFKPPQQRAVRARKRKCTEIEGAPAGNTEEPHCPDTNKDAETRDSNSQVTSLSEEYNPIHLECTTAQNDGETAGPSLGEQEPLENTNTDGQEGDPKNNPTKTASEAEQAEAIATATSELSAVKGRGPQEDCHSGCTTQKEEDIETQQLSSPAQQPSHKTQSPSNRCFPGLPPDEGEVREEHILGEDEEVKAKEMDPKPQHVHSQEGPAAFSEPLETSESLEEGVCSGPEAQPQTVEGGDFGDPPAKKRLRRRMGMCGLRERERSRLDRQLCGRNAIEGEREEVGGTGEEDADETQPRKDTEEKNDGAALVDKEGTVESLPSEPDTPLSTPLEGTLEEADRSQSGGQDQHGGEAQKVLVAITTASGTEIATVTVTRSSDEDPNSSEAGTSSAAPNVDVRIDQEEVMEEKLPAEQEVGGDLMGLGTEEQHLSRWEEHVHEVKDLCSPEQEVCPSATLAAMTQSDPSGEVPRAPTEAATCMETVANAVAAATSAVLDAPPMPQQDHRGAQSPQRTTAAVPESTGTGEGGSAEEAATPAAPSSGPEDNVHPVSEQNPSSCGRDPSPVADPFRERDSFGPLSSRSVSDSQLNDIALNVQAEDQPGPECPGDLEDATELVCGLIRELSTLNRTVMAAHREMDHLRRGNKAARGPNRRPYGPRRSEI